MENAAVLKALNGLPELSIVKHPKNDLYNAECLTRKPHHRRKNVVGDINPNGSSFLLYMDGQWVSNNKHGVQSINALLEWVKKDIETLSK